MINYIYIPATEISAHHVEQYVAINHRVYPSFTTNRSTDELLQTYHSEDGEEINLILAIEEQTDELVGWLQITPIPNSQHHHFNMLVDDKYQGRGIGSELLNQAKRHYDVLFGVMVEGNIYVRRDGQPYRSPVDFYKKNGFKLTGRTFTEYEEEIELVEMKWER